MNQTDQLQELLFSACKIVKLRKVYSKNQERLKTGGARALICMAAKCMGHHCMQHMHYHCKQQVCFGQKRFGQIDRFTVNGRSMTPQTMVKG